jgi:hypothetical protein
MLCAAGWAADGVLTPLTVCEVVRDLPAQEGKVIALLGRYSFRTTGRWMGEQACENSAPGIQPQLWLVEDLKNGPEPPEHLKLDGASLKRKFADIQLRTSLGKFRFGTADYDRWAVVYGRVEQRKGDRPALIYRGSSVIIMITPGEW